MSTSVTRSAVARAGGKFSTLQSSQRVLRDYVKELRVQMGVWDVKKIQSVIIFLIHKISIFFTPAFKVSSYLFIIFFKSLSF